ncbi:hypothetical protein [Streptomyces sp. NRRL F-525]|uniref:hypothetical protein n=1 Tax=Streptomyces sp. NRRL F-525 TaxID=1463861 RepID=UPI0005257F07|nr:hypothetical protein [Streptomyces sp. NRRL F-525]
MSLHSMNDDTTEAEQVLGALRQSMDGVTMDAPVERITAAGRARSRRQRLAKVSVVAAAAAGLALGVNSYGNPATAPPAAGNSTGAGSVHIHTAAFSVDTKTDGTVHVSWDKAKYFSDHAGLQAALAKAGLPVIIKVGEFCLGPGDDASLDHGQGPGVAQVVKGERKSNGRVDLVFTPSAMPQGKQLFIGYLNAAQLAASGGRPGSVERLVPTGVTLNCTTQAPTHD